ncbi:transglycosylase SLT domain-containing protein [Siccirubricoccus deserti]|uniref:Transglycosylase SLT domain-containing protein n=1 Tax=Siccirubricoccus deserti TaxID=2013562 RepID=A0A9X0UFU0_9PROT|nr:transglycosylase SLT domain-containing protein [Siccirubricoccus deserti]
MLVAIGQVESGRQISGRRIAWPWTINAAGKGHVFGSLAAAKSHIAALQANGVRSIDVGCFQVNLMHHPAAFSSLDEALDPHGNAHYAARFLHSLYGRAGSWGDAIALYHSATPRFGEAYRERVLAAWTDRGGLVRGQSAEAIPPSGSASALVSGWRVLASTHGVQVWTPKRP